MKKHQRKKHLHQNKMSYKGILVTVVLLQLSSLVISVQYDFHFGKLMIEQNMTIDLSVNKDK